MGFLKLIEVAILSGKRRQKKSFVRVEAREETENNKVIINSFIIMINENMGDLFFLKYMLVYSHSYKELQYTSMFSAMLKFHICNKNLMYIVLFKTLTIYFRRMLSQILEIL